LEQVNTGAPGSTSETRFACATLKHTSLTQIEKDRHCANTSLVNIADTDGEVPIISFRPTRILNGQTSRGVIKFDTASIINDTTSTPVMIKLRSNVTSLTSNSFVETSNTHSCMEYDISATAINTTGTMEVKSSYLAAGEHNYFEFETGDPHSHEYELFLHGDGNTQPTLTITAQVMKTGAQANVGATVNWGEIRL